jgi:nucleoside-diphosphate-sugar epimerase
MKVLIIGANGNIGSILKEGLKSEFEVVSLGKKDLDLLDCVSLENHFSNNQYDALINTAVVGGRRTKDEPEDTTHKNLLMFENIMKYSTHFKIILNLDSAAIYDRSTDILSRSEYSIDKPPTDYYGLSKYVIYQRCLMYQNVYTLRIFNIFHDNEENDRFIKSCKLAQQNNSILNIHEDKEFDFFYSEDFVMVVKYYLKNNQVPKTVNICYPKKYRLSDIAKMIISDHSKINIIKSESTNNYSGNGELLNSLNIPDVKKDIAEYFESRF